MIMFNQVSDKHEGHQFFKRNKQLYFILHRVFLYKKANNIRWREVLGKKHFTTFRRHPYGLFTHVFKQFLIRKEPNDYV